MKLLLSGSSGFIGTEVLIQALANPTITSIIALSRKPLPEHFTTNQKLSVVIIEDFNSYTPAVLAQLEGADACIWAIGAKSTDVAVTRKVTVEYTLAAVTAFSKLPRSTENPFRFVFLSGFIVVRDQKKSVWLFPEARKVGGEAEINLVDFAAKTSNFESYIARPAFVLPKNGGLMNMVMGALPSVHVDELSSVLLDTVQNGSKMQTLENKDIRIRARELLSVSKS